MRLLVGNNSISFTSHTISIKLILVNLLYYEYMIMILSVLLLYVLKKQQFTYCVLMFILYLYEEVEV